MTPHNDWTRGEPRILAQRCDTGHVWYLPRPRCPRCGGAVSSFEPAGTGTVSALTTVLRRADGLAGSLRIALVDLDAGVRLMARAGDDVAVGSHVVVRANFFEPEGTFLPVCEVQSA